MTRRASPWAWLWLLLGALYFFVPLIATIQFSLKAKKDVLSFTAYQNVLVSPAFFESFAFSFRTALLTIVISSLLIVPTAILMSSLGDSVEKVVTNIQNHTIEVPPPRDRIETPKRLATSMTACTSALWRGTTTPTGSI